MKINAIIIDDERKALAILKSKVERFCPNVQIIAETQSPKKGIELMQDLKPQLVFLDIAMPSLSGFDVLAAIDNPSFEIIFVTAFDTYAIEAIQHCAIGYLVKPINNNFLVEAVNKASINIEEKSALKKNKQLIENLGVQTFKDKKIVIPTQDGLEFVKVSSIVHFKGDNGYTQIHFSDRKSILSSHSIGYFDKILGSKDFYLIHKSHLINLNYIEKYHNEGYVILEGNIKLQVSRNKRKVFLNSLRNIKQ